jgi:type I restriction enzyme R subunit
MRFTFSAILTDYLIEYRQMNMKKSESDTRAKYIDTALKHAGWDEDFIIREYFFTDGRKFPGGKRGPQKWADYLLRYNNVSLAVVEAKRIGKEATDGLQQVIEYAQMLNVRFAYCTNGNDLYEFDMVTGKGKYVKGFPSPDELYKQTFQEKNEIKERLLKESFHLDGNYRPRYYQEIAVQRTMEAVAEGQKRILLTLATGTGKTMIAFQIVHKLFEARWNIDGTDRRPRVLFLADRNVLADQAINTFNNPYEKDLVKIDGEEIRKRNGVVPTNAHIFFAIYQAVAEKENIGGYYKMYPKDFFDLVIIDECHRGSANEVGSWRNILDYFDTAVHIGLTATPKRSDNVDTYKYFGKPVYEYSLRQGIQDGFLTPYKVKRIRTNIDEFIPTAEDQVVQGELEKDLYELPDFNRSIVIPEREMLLASAILHNIRTFDKTIIFCVDQNHARIVRDAINSVKSVNDPNYCVRITSNEGIIGRQLLEAFQDNDKTMPVVLTTSQMLTTGVDARNVRNIVLLRTVNSMVEFKQIVGRGTRVYDGKDFFTVIDFTGATNKFYDDEWDGIPEEAEEQTLAVESLSKMKEKADEIPVMLEEAEEDFDEEETKKKKTVVRLSSGRQLKVLDIEVRYVGDDGRPLTAKEYLDKLLGILPKFFDSEAELRELWSKPETREELLRELANVGFDEEQLESLQKMVQAEDSDIFDVLAFLVFESQMRTREERAEDARNETLTKPFKNNKAKFFLSFLIDRYERDGIDELKRDRLGELITLSKMTVSDATKAFGSSDNLLEAYYDVQKSLYKK